MLILGLLLSLFAQAESVQSLPAQATQSSTSSSNGSSGLLKKFEETSTVTDAKIKADAGSLSVLSLRFNLSYYGPPVGDLGALNQPNPDNTVTATATAISGTAGARYRFTSDSSLSISAGISDLYPFTRVQKLDANNPVMYFDQTTRIGKVQILSSPGVSLITSDVYRKVGETYGASYKLSAAYNIGETRFAVAMDDTINYYFFDRPYNKKKDGKVQRASMTLAPGVKYNVNRKLSVNTSWGISLFNPRAEASTWPLYNRKVNQRIGLGYALTRDVYLNPYIQFYPGKMELRTATFNLSSSFSIF